MSVLARAEHGVIAQFCTPKPTQAIIATSTTSAQSAAVSATTTIVEIWSSADCFFAVGADPTAVTTPGASGIRLRAESPMSINIEPGHKVAFILVTGTGTAEVTEMA